MVQWLNRALGALATLPLQVVFEKTSMQKKKEVNVSNE